MRRRWVAGFGVLAVLTASCGGPSPSASVAPGASVPAAASECTQIDMAGPSGLPVRLTGNWRANDQGTYDIQQRESCIFWIGMSQDLGSGPGQFWTQAFVGTIRSDFTIDGRWGDVPFNPAIDSNEMGLGSITLKIEFDTSGDVDYPVLRAVGGTGGFGGSTWVLEESLPAPTDLEGPFGGIEEEGCVWVEADGQRVELLGSGEWTYRNPPLSIQDDLGHILARVGDSIRVRGQLSPVLGSGCADTAILVWELNPIP